MKWRLAQKVELWWWKDYLNRKDKTSYLAWKKAYWENILEILTPEVVLSSPSKILDAACGPAGIYMALDGHEVVGVDPLLQSYKQHLAHFDPADYPFVAFENKPIEEYKAQQCFDLVFCMNGINHVSDLKKAMTKLIDCTKPGGYIVLTIDAHNYKFFKYLLRMVPGDILHPHQFSLKEYKDMFNINSCRYILQKRLKAGFLFDHYLLAVRKDPS